MNNKKTINVMGYIPYAILVLVFIFNTYILIKYGKGKLHSDMASEMVLANLMNEDNDLLFCKNWAYSTEIRVIYLQAAFRLGLLLFPNNWYYARVFGTDLMMILLIISFIHLCKTLKIEKYGVWLSIILLSPISEEYFGMMGFGGSYIPHVLLYLLLTDFAIQYHNDKSNVKMIIVILLGIIGGINGVRITFSYMVPLFIVIFLLIIVFDKPKNIWDLIKIYLAKYKIFVIEFISILAGYLFNSIYLKNVYTFMNLEILSIYPFDFDSFINMFVHIFELFGWKSIGAIFNSETFYTGFAATFFIVLIIAFIWFIKNIKEIIKNDNKFLFAFMIAIPITFIECDVLFNIFRRSQSRYWIPMIPFCLIAIAFFLNNSSVKKSLKNSIICLMLLSIFLTSTYTIREFIKSSKKSVAEEITNYLLENELTQGYASFWNANVFTELSNGEIEVWFADDRFTDESTYSVFNWLQDVRHLNEDPINEKVFLFLVDGTDFIDSTNIEKYKVKKIGPNNIYVFNDYNKIKLFFNTREVE